MKATAKISIVLGRKTMKYEVPAAAVPQIQLELERVEATPWREALGVTKENEPGQMLRAARAKAGLSQAELAAALGEGVRQSHVADMEGSRRAISKAMARRLGDVLKMDYRIFL